MKWRPNRATLHQTDAMRQDGDPYENLANAIVVQAAKDYIDARDEWRLQTIERFFLSDYFKLLTEIDPVWLINTLNLERLNLHRTFRRPKR